MTTKIIKEGINAITTETQGSEGQYSHAITTGASTNASVSNQNAIACSLGINSRASGQLGSWLVLTEWKYNCKIKNNQLIKVRAVRVDGKKIKPGAWYKIENGQIVECEQNCYTPLTLII